MPLKSQYKCIVLPPSGAGNIKPIQFYFVDVSARTTLIPPQHASHEKHIHALTIIWLSLKVNLEEIKFIWHTFSQIYEYLFTTSGLSVFRLCPSIINPLRAFDIFSL